MERIEARVTRPLHPVAISRESATFPRAQENYASLIFDSTERFRTGNDALFAAARAELGHTFRHAQSGTLPKSTDMPITVAIASSNNRKVDKMLSLAQAHQLDVIRIPEAQEWHTENVIVDATSKAVDAARIIAMSEEDSRRDVRNRPHVTMATDQLNAIPVIVDDPSTHLPSLAFERIGKPQNERVEKPLETVRKTFQQLALTAAVYNWTTIPYLTELATVIHNPQDPMNNAVSLQKSLIFLSVDGVASLATDRFDEYVARAAEQASKVNGKEDITGISGGFELQVLEDMGIIQFITGTPSEVYPDGFPPTQRLEAKSHAYSLTLGDADKFLVREYFGIEGSKPH
ncbi:MAG TPA: hypothetical protein VEW42_05495 [Candidatus Eisenbacteria bacterium]|nr:hypothetical protein [Candidatus Eisenbacteria bacterium]